MNTNEMLLKLEEDYILLPIDDLELCVILLSRNNLLLRDYTSLEDSLRAIKYVLESELEKRNKITQSNLKEIYED